LIKAFLALAGLSRILFAPIATIFASGGALQYFTVGKQPRG